MSLIPTMGATFVVESFVTVVIGGANVLLGTAPAGVLLAIIRTSLNAWHGQIVGQIGLLIAVILVIRRSAGRHYRLDEPSHALNLEENFLMLKLLNGPHTFGSGPRFWGGFLVVLVLVLAYPFFATPYDVGNFAYFFIWLFMALGLCLMWGYGGIMSFGQTFFFGLAGYAYGVIAIDLGGKGFTTFEALGVAVLLSAFAAVILGYFMIWGRVGGVFFGIVTLAATLVLAFFLARPRVRNGRLGALASMASMA